MTTKLYAIHDSKGVMVSESIWPTKDDSWNAFVFSRADFTNVNKIPRPESPEDLIKQGYQCLPVVVSNPKTEVVISRGVYKAACDCIDASPYDCDKLIPEVEQFLEAGNPDEVSLKQQEPETVK